MDDNNIGVPDGFKDKSNDDPRASSDERSGSNGSVQEGSAQSDSDEHCEEFDCRQRTESSRFNTQFSMHKFMRVLSKLTEEQKAQIRSCGFGSILDLNCSVLPHYLVVWLAKQYDEKSASIKISGTQPIKLDAMIVHQILGIPYGGKKLLTKPSKDAKTIIASDTGCENLAPKVVELIDMINPGLGGDKFVRIFMLIALSVFLCPTSCFRVSHSYYEAIRNVRKIRHYNWCDAVLTCLLSGLRKFQLLACKGNTAGKATLGGCVFVLFTAYFDCLITKDCTVPQTMPRISAWTDLLVSDYMMLHSKLDRVEIKAHECTLFANSDLKSKPSEGVFADGSKALPTAASKSCLQPPQHSKFAKTRKKIKNPVNQSKTAVDCNLQIDTDSAQNIIPEGSHITLSALCGEVLHPDVENFIHTSVGKECSNEVVRNLKNMCQSFFKESVKQYLSSIEPILINQSCEMVRSFLCGMELSKDTKSNSDDPKTAKFTCGTFNDGSTQNPLPDHEVNDIDKSPKDKCVKCHFCDAVVEPHTVHTCDAFDPNQFGMHEKSETPSLGQGKRSLSFQLDSAVYSAVSASKKLKSWCPGEDNSCEKMPKDKQSDSLDASPSNSNYAKSHSVTLEHTTANLPIDQEGPQKEGTGEKYCDSTATDLMQQGKKLSALGHKKHALKKPRSEFINDNLRIPRFEFSQLEKAIYHEAVKRPPLSEDRYIIAEIGRMSITHREFSDTMGPNTCVGTFVMSLFCEALNNCDILKALPVHKGFLTSAEVDFLKHENSNVDVLLKRLNPTTIGFNICELDMVMMPICYCGHWSLLVANLRDNRFDVLSSLPWRAADEAVTSWIRTNFERVFKSLSGENKGIDIKSFPTVVQDAPSQNTLNDCGIYVMCFMLFWDGRKINPIHPEDMYNYRVRFTHFMMTHPKNKKLLPSIKKLLMVYNLQIMHQEHINGLPSEN